MCLWLLTACLGLLPANPSPTTIVVVGAPPAPILVPTSAPTVTPTLVPTVTPSRPPNMTVTFPPPPTNMTGTLPPPPANNTGMPPPPPANNTGTPPPPPTGAPSGMPSIDPRLGTTPATSAALQVPPITGYSAQIPSYDTAVKFPRQRRNAPMDVPFIDLLDNFGAARDGVHRIRKRQSCTCVPVGTCVNNGTNAGAGMIDIRIVTPGGISVTQCPVGQEYCCGTSSQVVVACGVVQAVPAPAIAPAVGQANFGEYPWQAIILTKQNDYIAGGVLIDQYNILTVTHRLLPYVVAGTAPNVKVRLGEWDAAGTYEPLPYQEYTVRRVSSHPSYNPTTLQYDITILRLSTPVPLTPMNGSLPSINRACLPPSAASTYTGQRCWVSGWGKNMFGLQGQYQQILKKVDVPIVAPATCQTQMQVARLGASFVLDTTSFICAGGEANKDACTGDGGSGLVCTVNGQAVVVGLVAWGLGCAAANVPAAYVNIAGLLPWIQSQIAIP